MAGASGTSRPPGRWPVVDAVLGVLTPSRAFGFFSGAYAVGVLALLVPSQVAPYLVVLPISIYTYLLWYAQHAHYRHLNTTLKDSPYFLGFLLTLTALVRLFYAVSNGGLAAATPAVIGAAAGAIVATLVGLFGRQLLHSTDVVEAGREALFESMAEELRVQAEVIGKAQGRFSGLLTEFTDARENQLVREEAALKKWVAAVELVTETVDHVTATWQPALGGFIRQLTVLSNELATLRGKLCGDLEAAGNAVVLAAQDSARAIATASTAQTSDIDRAREVFSKRIDALVGSVERGAELINKSTDDAGAAADRHKVAASLLVDGFRSTATAAESARDALQSLASGAVSINEKLTVDVHEAGRGLVEQVRTAGVETREALRQQLNTIAADVKAVDELLTQVLGLMGEHYTTKPATRA